MSENRSIDRTDNDPSEVDTRQTELKPLGLPNGSVRAIIALATVATLLYTLVAGIQVEDWAIMGFTLIVGNYFEQRRK